MKNSDSFGTINHKGIVQKVDDKNVTVSISAESACSGCHAEGYCTISGKEEKIIEVAGSYKVKPGDTVTILMKQSMGYAALFLGYILPLISVIAILIVLISSKVPELVAGVASLAILIPYYVTLSFFRKRINEKFTFTLKA
ncbi:MAG: SoxR reducing system RseC family protein [Bacteroidia bacterium]|nr:SoxR reducing system RseC family protein [Bacteroidia bacterium]